MKPNFQSTAAPLLGEDVAEFRRMRQEMYDLHRPRTGNEARCVEAMATYEWGMARCRGLWSAYHDKLRALVHGNPGGTPAAEPHCERDPHRWHHSAMDCGLDAKRLAGLAELERRKLERMQKLRRQNALDDAKARADRVPVVAPPEDVPEEVLAPLVLGALDAAGDVPLAAEDSAAVAPRENTCEPTDASTPDRVGRASLPGREDAREATPPANGSRANGGTRTKHRTNHPSGQRDAVVDAAEEPVPTVATFGGRPAHPSAHLHPHHPRGQPGASATTAAVPAQGAEP